MHPGRTTRVSVSLQLHSSSVRRTVILGGGEGAEGDRYREDPTK